MGIKIVKNFAINNAGNKSVNLLYRITTALPPIKIAVNHPKKSPNTRPP